VTQILSIDAVTWERNIDSYILLNAVFVGYLLLVVAYDCIRVRLQNLGYEGEI
jgi:hypothetical protein